tara:strand:- start:5754 stop:6122 length:369 start_codon:yes stop_codon:yes gene_type:complete
MDKDYLDISELSVKLELINKKTGKPANYILRFWEKEFSGIKPIILKGNRRYYDKRQVDKISYIKYLLKDKGLTIKGAKQILRRKKNIDGTIRNNIEKDYLKNSIKNRSTNILKKIKGLKNYG